MLSLRVKALLALNGALVVLLAVLTLWPAPLVDAAPALAQPTAANPAARQRGQYVMVSGRAQGSTSSVIYILDAGNQEMVAVRYNRGSQRLEPVGYRSLIDDGKPGGGGR